MDDEDLQQDRREIRVSDADRETAGRWLATAAGQGRITMDEMEDRIARARQARTYGDIEQLVRDLPSGEQPGTRRAPETLRISASLRNARMRGPWKVPPRIVASAGRGSVLLDFSSAVNHHHDVTVDARPNWRNVQLVVPEGYRVTTEESVPGTGDIRNLGSTDHDPDEPHIHVVARPGLGSVVIRPPRGRRRLPHLRWPRRRTASERPR